jgi:outer membrane receptor protein involved in Fe transport
MMAWAVAVSGTSAEAAAVSGTVVAAGAQSPLELAAVQLKRAADGVVVQSTATDQAGRFAFEAVPVGEYLVAYGLVGADARTGDRFAVATTGAKVDLGRLTWAEPALQLEKFSVTGKQQEFYNTIDRKTYSVGKEIQSATGSASDLLQNIPSVQVDIDGGVSLRGSENVLILINGRTSNLMGKTRGEVLQQLPADTIDKIEVITNPSAKYKPDGTAGIINITLKKKQSGRTSASASVSVGNDDRRNAGLNVSYNPGKFTVFGGYSYRHDFRVRTGNQTRTVTTPGTGAVSRVEKESRDAGRPVSHVIRGGVTYAPDEANEWGVSGNFFRRVYTRDELVRTRVSDGTGRVLQDYDRLRHVPDWEESVEGTATYLHRFAGRDHELSMELKASRGREREPGYYTNIYRTPNQPATADNHLPDVRDQSRELVVEYTRALDEVSKFEAGYTFTDDQLDTELIVEERNPATGLFVRNLAQSYLFIHEHQVHAGYVTYARSLGAFGFLAGLRGEQSTIDSRLVTTGQSVPNDYGKAYPSLHLSYHLSDEQELQLNYSHRVRRPESEELNPFVDYSDPLNLYAGNPRLRPEDTHSFEAGYQFRRDQLSFLSTVYHRIRYNSFTSITQDQGNGVLLTTQQNLGQSDATGLEIATTAELTSKFNVNFSTNVFFNTIDASNLGFSSRKSDVSWTAKLSANYQLGKDTLLQFNTNYTSTRLTPQGERLPTYISNLGVRHEFYRKKLAAVLTISDLFNHLQDRTVIDTPGLQGEFNRRRSPRIVYLGLTYYFGQQSKKSKDDAIKFEEAAP